MTLSNEEVEALKAYFDATTINVLPLRKKIGKEVYDIFDKVLNRLYDNK